MKATAAPRHAADARERSTSVAAQSSRRWTSHDESGTLHGFVEQHELRRLLALLAGTELVSELAKTL